MFEPPTNTRPMIISGENREIMRTIPEESVQCVVTSPPYWGLRAYGTNPQVWDGSPDCEHEWALTPPRRERHESDVVNGDSKQATNNSANIELKETQFCQKCGAWKGELGLEPTIELYVQHLVEIFREVKRVLHPTGIFFLNLGDSYSGSGKAGSNPDYQKRHTEFGKPSIHKERFGLSGIVPSGLKPKDLVGIPWRVAFALQADGWWLRSDIIWSKPNPMPESVTDRPTKSHEYVFLLTKSQHYYYDADAVREPSIYPPGSREDVPRGRFNGKYDNGQFPGSFRAIRETRNRRSVWTIAIQPTPEAHFATFPEALVETCVKAGTSERGCCPKCGAPWERVMETGDRIKHDSESQTIGSGRGKGADRSKHAPPPIKKEIGWRPSCSCQCPDTIPCLVLDPFVGSGTTCKVSMNLGRRSVGIDLNPAYIEIAKRKCGIDISTLEEFHG